MAICLIKKGGGGIQSEDTTALRSEVLAGKTALTADSNDEVVQGTMSLLDRAGFDVVNMRLAHQRTDGKGRGYVVDSPTHGRGIAVSVKPPDGKKYALDNNVELVFKSEPDLRAENIRGDKNIAGVQGSIPLWNPARSGYSDMLYAWNNEGHCIDHPVAGRGVVLKIGNGYLIENANWVFLKVPTLLPWNIRKGVNVFGVEGTLPDYSAGRVVFNGATLDGDLLLGVASKSYVVINDMVNYQIDQSYGYSGIYNGGLNISLNNTFNSYANRYVGFCFSHSVDMTPFKRVVVDYRSVGNISGNPSIEGVFFITPVRTLVRGGVIDHNGQPIDKFNQSTNIARVVYLNGQVTIDTSSLSEQCFIGFYACVYRRSSNRDIYIGQLQITRIEFVN